MEITQALALRRLRRSVVNKREAWRDEMNRRNTQRAFANARQELRVASVSEACLRKSVVNTEHGVQVGRAEDIPRALPTKPVVERRGGTCIRPLAHKPQTDGIRLNGCQKGDYETLLQRGAEFRWRCLLRRLRALRRGGVPARL